MAAIIFNASVLLDHEERIKRGELPASLDDRDPLTRLDYSGKRARYNDDPVIPVELLHGLEVLAWS